MAIKGVLVILILTVLSTCIADHICPSKEYLPHCSCTYKGNERFNVVCTGLDTGYAIADYKEVLQIFNNTLIDVSFKDFFSTAFNISSNVFEGLYLRRLEIMYGSISVTDDDEEGLAFVGLEDILEELTIVHAIQRPQRDNQYYEKKPLFKLGHLRSLREVDLSLNDLYYIGNDWFSANPALKAITFRSGFISGIGDRAFASLNNIQKITATGNEISTISRSMFPNPAPHLKVLDFGKNRLTAIPGDLFRNMPSLTNVLLASNRIQILPERTWRWVWPKLQLLDLSENRLSCHYEYIAWMIELRLPKVMYAVCDEYNKRNMYDIIKVKQKDLKIYEGVQKIPSK